MRDDLGGELVDKRSDQSNESDNGSCFSHGNQTIDHLSIDKKKDYDIGRGD